MIDTIAAICSPRVPLSDQLFSGGVVQTDFGADTVQARLWRNPEKDGPYEPRCTYWRGGYGDRTGADLGDFVPRSSVNTDGLIHEDAGYFKIEFSVPKLLELPLSANVTLSDVDRAIEKASAFVQELFSSEFPPLGLWKCQRVDYAWNFDVGDRLAAYMSVLDKLRLKNYSRHPFEAQGGVVWKSRGQAGRWVKFYNKTREQGLKGKAEVLRFEVSNYSKSIPYMADRWFGCERWVADMTRFGRALYMMCRVWDDLGLGSGEEYGQREWMDVRLREAFGKREVARASYALRLIERYGTSAYSEDIDLIPRTTYYRWRKRLAGAGLLASVGNGDGHMHDVIQYAPLPALSLPVSEVLNKETFREKVHNLECFMSAAPKEREKLSWEILAGLLDIKKEAKASRYLVYEAEEWMNAETEVLG